MQIIKTRKKTIAMYVDITSHNDNCTRGTTFKYFFILKIYKCYINVFIHEKKEVLK